MGIHYAAKNTYLTKHGKLHDKDYSTANKDFFLLQFK